MAPSLQDVTARLRDLRDAALHPPGAGATAADRAAWAEASQQYDGLLLRAALMLDIPIGDASPVAPPVLSQAQRNLLEDQLADAGLDLA